MLVELLRAASREDEAREQLDRIARAWNPAAVRGRPPRRQVVGCATAAPPQVRSPATPGARRSGVSRHRLRSAGRPDVGRAACSCAGGSAPPSRRPRPRVWSSPSQRSRARRPGARVRGSATPRPGAEHRSRHSGGNRRPGRGARDRSDLRRFPDRERAVRVRRSARGRRAGAAAGGRADRAERRSRPRAGSDRHRLRSGRRGGSRSGPRFRRGAGLRLRRGGGCRRAYRRAAAHRARAGVSRRPGRRAGGSSRTGSSTTRRIPICTASWPTGCCSPAIRPRRRGQLRLSLVLLRAAKLAGGSGDRRRAAAGRPVRGADRDSPGRRRSGPRAPPLGGRLFRETPARAR